MCLNYSSLFIPVIPEKRWVQKESNFNQILKWYLLSHKREMQRKRERLILEIWGLPGLDEPTELDSKYQEGRKIVLSNKDPLRLLSCTKGSLQWQVPNQGHRLYKALSFRPPPWSHIKWKERNTRAQKGRKYCKLESYSQLCLWYCSCSKWICLEKKIEQKFMTFLKEWCSPRNHENLKL